MAIAEVELTEIERKIQRDAFLAENDPWTLAKEHAIGMVGHFLEFVEGKQDNFQRYFLISETTHLRQQKHFLEQLNLPEYYPKENPAAGQTEAILRLGDVVLERWSNLDNRDKPFDVNYAARRLEPGEVVPITPLISADLI